MINRVKTNELIDSFILQRDVRYVRLNIDAFVTQAGSGGSKRLK